MIIQICDLCGLQTHGTLERFRVEKCRSFDVGPCCIKKPFSVPDWARTTLTKREVKATSAATETA